MITLCLLVLALLVLAIIGLFLTGLAAVFWPVLLVLGLGLLIDLLVVRVISHKKKKE